MKIIVDELPNEGRECLFAIHEPNWKPYDERYKPQCKLRIETDYDWNHLSFSTTDNMCNCLLDLNGECPYLKIL